MNRIEGNQINGLDSEEMDFMEILCGNTGDEIFDQWTGLPIHTGLSEAYELTENQLNEIHNLEEEAKSNNTKRQTEGYIKILKRFLETNNLPNNIEDMPIRYLESYLRLFFTKIRKRNNEHYAVASLVCMRAAFHRYLLEKRRLEIIDNPSFHGFDKTYKASINASLKFKEEHISEGGCGFSSIDEDDLKSLGIYFNRSTPQRLQDEVFF